MVKFHWIYLHTLTRLFSSNIRPIPNYPPFQLPDNFPIFQISNLLVTWFNQSIWLSGFWLSCYLAYLALWLSGWTLSSGWLNPLVALLTFSTCCDITLHLLLILHNWNPLVDYWSVEHGSLAITWPDHYYKNKNP